MKVINLLVVCLMLSLSAFSQPPMPNLADTAKPKQYVLVVTEQDLSQIFSVMRTSAKYSAMDIEGFIDTIMKRLTLLAEPKKTSK